jgi:hypothetical protein
MSESEPPERTTLNIDGDVHRKTRDVKDTFGESWTDVLRFYARHRSEVSLSDDDGDSLDAGTLAELESEVARLADAVEQAPERTADELEGRFR